MKQEAPCASHNGMPDEEGLVAGDGFHEHQYFVQSESESRTLRVEV